MQKLTIDNASDTNQRIDKFLKKYLTEAPLGGIYKWLRTGKIKVNRKKVEQTYRIEEWDEIEIWLKDEEISGMRKITSLLKNPLWQKEKKESFIWQSILYEDDSILVINKPAGINVHPGDHKTDEASLIELVQDYLGERYNSLSFRPALVHRIDRDTSGAIIIAKEKKMLDALLTLLQSGRIEKVYHTIVVGTSSKARDTITAKLLRLEDAHNEAKVRVDTKGQEAITHYSTIKNNIHTKYSLLECRIETGRTHQIRVHMAYIGTPILGDKAYGNLWENSFARRKYGLSRQLLHAYSLSFIHPETHEKLTIIAPYHEDMSDFLMKHSESMSI